MGKIHNSNTIDTSLLSLSTLLALMARIFSLKKELTGWFLHPMKLDCTSFRFGNFNARRESQCDVISCYSRFNTMPMFRVLNGKGVKKNFVRAEKLRPSCSNISLSPWQWWIQNRQQWNHGLVRMRASLSCPESLTRQLIRVLGIWV